MVHGAQRLGRGGGGGEVGGSLETDRERVQARPPGFVLALSLDPGSGVAGGEAGHDRRVEASGEQNPVRHVGHELALDRALEAGSKRVDVERSPRHGRVRAPGRLVVALGLTPLAVEDVARRKLLQRRAHVDDRLHLGRDVQVSVGVVPDVQRHHPDRIACHHVSVSRGVVKDEREDPVQLVEKIEAALAVQREDDLAIRRGLKLVGVAQPRRELAMVVDLAVHRQRQHSVGAAKRLSAVFEIDDGQPLVGENRVVVAWTPLQSGPR